MAKLQKLFEVTQAIMVNRNNLLEDAMNEAEAETKKALKKGNQIIFLFHFDSS